MTWASSTVHARKSVKKESRRTGRRLCGHDGGCKNPSTHFGQANGVTLTSGCEWHMARWVKTGR